MSEFFGVRSCRDSAMRFATASNRSREMRGSWVPATTVHVVGSVGVPDFGVRRLAFTVPRPAKREWSCRPYTMSPR